MQKCPQCKMRKVQVHTLRDNDGRVRGMEHYCTNCQSVVRLKLKRRK